MNIESLRIREKQNVINRINEVNIYIKRNKETIDRLSSQEQSVFNKNQIAKLEEKQNEYEKELNDLDIQFENIAKGKLDNQFIDQAMNTANVLRQNMDEKERQKNDKKAKEKIEKNINLQKSYSISNKWTKGEMSERDYQREFSRFEKNCETIPDYILSNLKEMPGNKGYIWKGIYLYGELPEEKNEPQIMFEKLRGGILRIHETHDKGDHRIYKIYEKQGKNKRVFVSEESKKKVVFRKIH
jgi:hypothetical protein